MFTRPGAVSPATVLLPVVAFAVTTALLLTVLGGTLMFWQWTEPSARVLQLLSLVALSLLLVPLATLGGAAARLAARRRDDRLATLRLLGASTWTITLMTAVESTALAVLGSVAGVVVYTFGMPLVGLIPFEGKPIGPVAIWVGPVVILVTVAAVAMLGLISSIAGLRQVVITPLGVRVKQRPPRVSPLRLVGGTLAVIVAFVLLKNLDGLGAAIGLVVVVVAFSIAIAAFNLSGPFVLSLFARRKLRVARTAAQLISARGILESPKAAWRLVSGVAMTSFTAVVIGSGAALSMQAGDGGSTDPTATDIRTGIFITLVASFLMVACSAGVSQAAAVLERRELYVSLDRLGMPVSVMDRARVRTVMAPLVFVALTSALVGACLIAPFVGPALSSGSIDAVVLLRDAVLATGGCIVLGIALVRLSLHATRPILLNVLAHPSRALG
ncbi:permease [Clavibacter sp. VKM Ac-2873]|nr:FtsX-like permease family protein [Clavibacter sp. VKM Ac-2873]MBF4619456.1 permease [Clavibacter sp. VKM Ac-2873]